MSQDSLASLACEDCPAEVLVSRGQGLAGPVLVVAVLHEGTCPWFARVVPSGEYVRATERGVILHHVKEGGGSAS